MQSTHARKWWKEHLKNYKESNPFSKKNDARNDEWTVIYETFKINLREYSRLVELGPGTGRIALNFLKKGFDVTGIDLSREALAIVKERTRKYNLSKRFHMLQSDLSFPINEFQETFDAGYIIVTYHTISFSKEEQKRVFKNFVGLIRRGGKILIMEPNPLNPLFYILYLFIYKGNLHEGLNIVNSRREILVSLLKESGMVDIRVYHDSFLPRSFINHWNFVKNINHLLCSVPVIRSFSAYHIITAFKK